MLKKTGKSFDVLLPNQQVANCFARGNIKTLANLQAGDHVELAANGNGYVVQKLLPRKNQLTRPYISNLDQLVIVVSHLPKPDLLLTDKLLIGCKYHGITPILVVNKADTLPPGFYDDILCQYGFAVEHILLTSAKTGQGVQELKELLSGKLTAFSGQSAVGKTSLINNFFPNLHLKTDGLSKRIQMGKNTTRDTQIFVAENGTLIADTPGFNMLHYEELDPNDLKNYYEEFQNFSHLCYYNNCNHMKENPTTCAVLQALGENKINQKRYERYVELFNSLQQTWRKKYD